MKWRCGTFRWQTFVARDDESCFCAGHLIPKSFYFRVARGPVSRRLFPTIASREHYSNKCRFEVDVRLGTRRLPTSLQLKPLRCLPSSAPDGRRSVETSAS